jgi:4-hydroxy-tetrahydrodipicolinate synthase
MNYAKSAAKEASRAAFRGVWAAITTPFTADLKLDEAGLRRNMRYVTGALRVDGVFCGGVIGEFWALTGAERRRVVEIVVEEARGKCGVMAHTGHHCAADAIELTQHAQDAGADFAIMMTPYYPAATDDMVVDWYTFVASHVDIGIWLFDTGWSGRPPISPEATARLATIENICGAKIARPLEHFLEVKRLCGDRLVLSSPNEADYLMMMRDHGQAVHNSSATPYLIQNAAWRPMQEYSDLGLQGRFHEAEAVSKTLEAVRSIANDWIDGRYRETGILQIAAIKAWSEMLGMAAGPVRTPLLQMSRQDRALLHGQLESAGFLGKTGQLAAAAE